MSGQGIERNHESEPSPLGDNARRAINIIVVILDGYNPEVDDLEALRQEAKLTDKQIVDGAMYLLACVKEHLLIEQLAWHPMMKIK